MSKKREYRPLTVPALSWNKKTLRNNFGELVVQPLEPGFGMTLGNALRRVLLSAIEGSAVTSVIIKGVNNEFSTIPGVIEDVMQILLNIKGIVIKNGTGIAGTMRLHKSGAGEVRVSDISADSHLELVNKDHTLAHLAVDGKLDVEFFVSPGRGYLTAQWPLDKALHETGKIYLDAAFSPVIRVAFDVEKTRVGAAIDYDKLTLQVYTNGSENPVDVLHYAVSVLRSQFEHFLKETEIPFNEISSPISAVEEPSAVQPVAFEAKNINPDLFLKPIDELEFSVRAHNCLINAGIKRVIDLVNTSEDDLLQIKNFGRKSLNEVKESMKAFGLSFGMNVAEEDVRHAVEESKTA
jgi:DNA-directed RNA polymerase subunit alpha